MKCADGLAPLTREETVLQGMIDRLILIGRCYGMEISAEKTKEMRISRPPSSAHTIMDQKQPENVEFFPVFG